MAALFSGLAEVLRLLKIIAVVRAVETAAPDIVGSGSPASVLLVVFAELELFAVVSAVEVARAEIEAMAAVAAIVERFAAPTNKGPLNGYAAPLPVPMKTAVWLFFTPAYVASKAAISVLKRPIVARFISKTPTASLSILTVFARLPFRRIRFPDEFGLRAVIASAFAIPRLRHIFLV